MGTLVAWHREVLATLGTALPSFLGPADSLPTVGGRIAQCAVLWPTTGQTHTRAAGGVHQRTDTVAVVFVGATSLDALAAVQKGRAALEGARLIASGTGGGQVREGGFVGASPTVEPGTDPVRVSLTVQFSAVTKDPR